jgi:hypothetical protein
VAPDTVEPFVVVHEEFAVLAEEWVSVGWLRLLGRIGR